MAATPKATRSQIEAALWQWGGDISQAAAQLGLTRRALYYRIESIGIDTDRIRRESQASHFGVKDEQFTSNLHAANEVKEETGSMRNEPRPKLEGVKYPRQSGESIVRGEMATAAAITSPEELMQGRLPRNPRVRPDHLRRLQELKWTMSAMLRRDLSETDILAMILDESLPTFERRAAPPEVDEQLMPQPPTPAKRPRTTRRKR